MSENITDREAAWWSLWAAYQVGDITSEEWSRALNSEPGMRAWVRQAREAEMRKHKRKAANTWKRAGGWR